MLGVASNQNFAPTLAILLACATAPSHAAVTVSAELADFRVSLVDLNPSDGLSPSFVFSGPYTILDVSAKQFNPLPSDSKSDRSETPGFSFLSATVSVSASSATGETSSTSMRQEGSAESIGSWFWSAAFFGSGDSGACYKCSPPTPTAVLSPWTQAVVTGKLDLFALINPGSVDDEYARAYFTAQAGWGGSGSYVSLGQYRSWVTAKNLPWNDESFDGVLVRDTASKYEEFTLVLANATDQFWQGEFSVHLYAEGRHNLVPPPAIPEPKTYALFTIGLGFVAMVARGQRRRWTQTQEYLGSESVARNGKNSSADGFSGYHISR